MQSYVPIILAVLAIIALGYLFMTNSMPSTTHPMRNSNSSMMSNGMPSTTNSMMSNGMPSTTNSMMSKIENFENMNSHPNHHYRSNFEDVPENVAVQGSEDIGSNSQFQSLETEETGSQMNELPSECYPKDVLSSADLLPRDANSLWAQVSPSGQGSLADQNFLSSGFHIGINTVGQTLRNANRQLRSEPLNPQVKVSPWMQTTIDPDINRRPLEINSTGQ